MSTLDIDPDANVSVREQLVNQLRYLIASGHYNVNDTLPSTRTLGDQLDVSFHTVRKAYQELEDEGLLSSQVGSGYTVKERSPLAKSERMERGAKVVNDTLQQLVGLGLSDAEIESLFQEQATLLDHAGLERKLIVLGPHDELNRLCADQLSTALQKTVLPVSLSRIERHKDADYAFSPYPYLTQVLETLSRTDTMGFSTHLPPDVLETVARLRDRETLGLVTRYQDTIPPLSEELRSQTAYDGQVIAASIDREADHLQSFVQETDLLLATPASQRRLRPYLDDSLHDVEELKLLVGKDSIEAIANAVPA
ncbi:GntR family transcriptional regulator [Salinibacter ruber]|uniref:GntR family transcriptional regulator n=1 Tax=Salinibacter ruber TaxID=146919 RepID=UPI0021681ED5|nr:GntR family transcriptional regulator [Salinibacter ruber]MCS3750082.1 GntR family transcriptional regulator [Salinibacter ruber]MCS4175650.1 GntR family transcriptional regulator [Salinibacter ruber]